MPKKRDKGPIFVEGQAICIDTPLGEVGMTLCPMAEGRLMVKVAENGGMERGGFIVLSPAGVRVLVLWLRVQGMAR